jgi:hypothetical protein
MGEEIRQIFNTKINEYDEQIKKNTADNMKIYTGLSIKPKQIIHIKYLATVFKNIVLKLKEDIQRSDKSNIDIVNDVFYIIVQHIEKINAKFEKQYDIKDGKTTQLLNIVKNLEKNNPDFIQIFEKFVKDNVSDKILTFVKINNFNHGKILGDSNWNKRFDVLLNSITNLNPTYNTMVVKYNDIDQPYYDNNENELGGIPDNIYPKTYLFGKFSQIFPPDMKNSEIADQMTQIVEKVKGGKPVFIMGYGASGSGKTSSLIHLKKVDKITKEIIYEEQGIIVDMCKQICEGDDDGFNKIVLNTEELFESNELNNAPFANCQKEGKDGKEGKELNNCKSNEYIFTYDKDKKDFEMEPNDQQNYETKHPYREPGPIGTKFGEILKYLIDDDRLVKATTNNPQSSRSHSFAFIKFIRESDPTKNGYLIVGDFAGVENTFNCDNIVTIRDFLNIRKNENETYYGGAEKNNTKKTRKQIAKELEEKLKVSRLFEEEQQRKIREELRVKEKQELDARRIQNDLARKKQQELLEKTQRDKIIAQQAADVKTAADTKIYMELLSQLSKREINENYLNNQIDALYNKYKEALSDKMNTRSQFKFDDDALTKILYEWIFNILGVEWIDDNENLNINMEAFKETRYDDMIRQLSASIKKCKIIDTYDSTKDNIKKLDNDYIKYEKVNKNPFNNTSKFKDYNAIWKRLLTSYENDIFLKQIDKYKGQYGTSEEDMLETINENLKTDEYNEKRNEILLNKHPFTNTYMQSYNTGIGSLNVIEIFNIENAILGDIAIVLSNFENRLTHGRETCNYRRYEGYFINQSLQEMRQDIKNIFYEKQRDNIFISPDYVNLCLEKYCPTHSDCFKKDRQPDMSIKSVVFNKIFNYLKTNGYFTQQQEEQKKFYQDILISVFCVFNISRSANNPPTVPYIDINELKIALKKFEKEYKESKITDDVKSELIMNLKKIYYKIKGTLFDENASYANENKFDENKTSSIQLFIVNKTNLFDLIYHNKNNNILSKLNSAPKKEDITYIKKFIETIDNSNAISAIGTLEFLDQISKYYTTQTICFLEEGQVKPPDYKEIYNADGEFILNK